MAIPLSTVSKSCKVLHYVLPKRNEDGSMPESDIPKACIPLKKWLPWSLILSRLQKLQNAKVDKLKRCERSRSCSITEEEA